MDHISEDVIEAKGESLQNSHSSSNALDQCMELGAVCVCVFFYWIKVNNNRQKEQKRFD